MKQTRSETFAIVTDISHMYLTDYLVKKEGAQIDAEVESNYVWVETMHPSIAKY